MPRQTLDNELTRSIDSAIEKSGSGLKFLFVGNLMFQQLIKNDWMDLLMQSMTFNVHLPLTKTEYPALV